MENIFSTSIVVVVVVVVAEFNQDSYEDKIPVSQYQRIASCTLRFSLPGRKACRIRVRGKYLRGSDLDSTSSYGLLDAMHGGNVSCDATVLITGASVRLQNALFVTTHDLVTSRKKTVTALQCWSHNG
eukprot:scaffold2958_cov162-Skeletonema_dohrnii-CCMP3373.AAC.2